MAARYGLSAADVFARLNRGRFRVKANIDHATANEYARDLEAIGARVTIEEERTAAPSMPSNRTMSRSQSLPLPISPTSLAQPLPSARPQPLPSARSQPLPPPLAQPLPASTGSSPLIPPSGQRNARSSLPAHRHPVTETEVADVDVEAQLGALGGRGALSLAQLDDDAPTRRAPWTTEDGGLPASIGPALPVATPSGPPIDLFAPPVDESTQRPVELADDELERRAQKRTSVPPQDAPRAPAPSSPPPTRSARPSPVAPSLFSELPQPRPNPSPVVPIDASRAAPPMYLDGAGPPQRRQRPTQSPKLAPLPTRTSEDSPSGQRRWFGSSRVRFAAGVVIAIVLGFVPAELYASLRERSAFEEIDARVIAAQAAVDSQQSYDALDTFRAAQLASKKTARRTIVLTAMLMWAAAGSGIAYVWFRRLPWDRLTDA